MKSFCRANSKVLYVCCRSMSTAEERIATLGLKMPAPAVPKGNFVNFVRIGNMAYLSGHLPQPADGDLVIGKVGKDVTPEQGYEVILLRKTCKCFGVNYLFKLMLKRPPNLWV